MNIYGGIPGMYMYIYIYVYIQYVVTQTTFDYRMGVDYLTLAVIHSHAVNVHV